MPTKPFVHVIDDDEAMRDSLVFLLEAHGFEARTYAEPRPFLDALAGISPGCVLTDIRMPNMTGLELVQMLKARGSRLPVVVMTGHADVGLAVEAMKAGVIDFIEKPFEDQTLLDAVRRGLASLDNAAGADPRAAAKSRLAQLSPRERDVLQGVVQGRPNKMIARDLGISPRTVEIYRAHAMAKAGAKTFSDLMRIALAAGL